MDTPKIHESEYRFCLILWEHGPITAVELAKLSLAQLGWKRTTTYTVLKKLCDRGIFATKDQRIMVLISKEEFHAMQSEHFVEQTFDGSLPAFLAAFTARKKPTAKELEEIKKLLESLGEK